VLSFEQSLYPRAAARQIVLPSGGIGAVKEELIGLVSWKIGSK